MVDHYFCFLFHSNIITIFIFFYLCSYNFFYLINSICYCKFIWFIWLWYYTY